MKKTIAVGVASLAFALASCGAPGVPGDRADKQAPQSAPEPPEHPVIRKPRVVVKCSDFVSGQEIFVAKQQGELTKSDKKSLDKDGDGYYCNEPGVKFKDTRTHAEGLPPFEVAFVADGNVEGIRSGEVVIDVSGVRGLRNPAAMKRDGLLEAVGWAAIEQIGPDTETGYRAAWITYRNAEGYKEIGVGVYVADQEAADRMNAHMREQGAEIPFVSGEIPPGGYLAAYKF